MYRTVWLWLLVIFVGIQFGAGWYEKLAIVPLWADASTPPLPAVHYKPVHDQVSPLTGWFSWLGLVVTAVAGYIPSWCAGKSGRQLIARLVKGFRCLLHRRYRRAPRLIALSVSIA